MQVAPNPAPLATSPVHDNHNTQRTSRLGTSLTGAACKQPEDDNTDDDADATDLGEVVNSDDYLSNDQDSTGDLSETDDSDMAKQIEAAGEGESLLGSDDSSDEAHLAEEEKYIIDDELHRSHTKHSHPDLVDGKSDDGYRSESAGTEEELNFDHDTDFWNALSPAAQGTDEDIGEEMFKPQRGFATSPEPSFSDFFASSDEVDEGKESGDDEMLTTDEDTMEESDGSSTISSASVSAPLIAHFGTSQELPGGAEGQHVDDPDADEDKSLKSAIPLLVIEDLDGRLIYARAGDGEAVFGSDGEFEFVGESEDDSSSDDLDGGAGYGFAGDANALPNPTRAPGASDTQTYDTGDDGDTTDELPDEDMPYPRLLVGSIAPRGGRNARRAREIAARSRRSSPRVSSPAPHGGAAEMRGGPRTPSALSQAYPISDDESELTAHEGASDASPTKGAAAHDTNGSAGHGSDAVAGVSRDSDSATGCCKPEMGQFIPALSKSVHRAVIDGSHRAPSPFSKRTPLKHGFGRRRAASRAGLSEDSLEHALSAPSRMKRKRSGGMPYMAPQYGAISTTRPDSSPEPVSPEPLDAMDLGDVLDENLIWEIASSDSEDEQSGNKELEDDSNAPRSSKNRMRRTDRSKLSGVPGLNYNAFARWNRIPIGAFRDSQKQTGGSHPSPMSEVYASHQRPTGAYLLTHPFPTSREQHLSNAMTPPARPSSILRAKERSPFQRTVSQGVASPLHRTLADASSLQDPTTTQSPLQASLAWAPASEGRANATSRWMDQAGDHTVVGGHFLVSPKLTPVKHSSRGPNAGNLGAPSAPGPFPHSRKVTKREKRERQARREAMKRDRRQSRSHSREDNDSRHSPLSYTDAAQVSRLHS